MTLVQQDGTAVPESGKPQPQFIQGTLRCCECRRRRSLSFTHLLHSILTVTLPSGVEAGQTIHVQAPDGRMNAIVIPPGFGPGSTFTVEFAPDEVPPPAKAEIPSSGDGFAAGFNNPNWRPDATATAVPANEPEVVVQATEQDADGSYPTTTYQPLYTTTPAYPSK